MHKDDTHLTIDVSNSDTIYVQSHDDTIVNRTLDTKLYDNHSIHDHTTGISPTDAWSRALQCLYKDDYNEAYRLVLNSNDDIYLLRLMYKTGPDCYRLLDDNISLRLFSRVVAVAKSRFLDDLTLDFFFEACDTGLASHVDRDTVESMVMVLESMDRSKDDNRLLNIVIDYLNDLKSTK